MLPEAREVEDNDADTPSSRRLAPERSVSLIGAASGWGAGVRETEDGPDALCELGLVEWLRKAGLAARWTKMVRAEGQRTLPMSGPNEIFQAVVHHAARLSSAVAGELMRGRFPVVIGGDHSVAMGTWSGVARALGGTPLGLVWFDAHLDAHTVETTPSMNPHGMPAAALLGHGDRRFLEVAGGVLRPEHLCFVGARSYEEGELALLRRLGVRIFFMEEVRRRGLAAVVEEASEIAAAAPGGFGVTLDLDGLDPADAPAVGLPTPDGLRAVELRSALSSLGCLPGFLAAEVVEYVPQLDKARRTAFLVGDLLLALCGPRCGCVR